jgi:GABA(A) receptor-associated protein
MKRFKDQVPDLCIRQNESKNLLRSHPDKIPVILEPQDLENNKVCLDQNKYLVPKLYTVHEFIFHIRNKLHLNTDDSLFLRVSGNLFPSVSTNLKSIYNEYQDNDGFLYITYSFESF